MNNRLGERVSQTSNPAYYFNRSTFHLGVAGLAVGAVHLLQIPDASEAVRASVQLTEIVLTTASMVQLGQGFGDLCQSIGLKLRSSNYFKLKEL